MVKFHNLDTIFRWVHLVAIAAGVGGVGFAVLVLFPSMPTVTDEAMRGALAGAVFGRFSVIAWTVMVTILITGVLMVLNRWPLRLRDRYTKVLIAKVVVVHVWAGTNVLVLLGYLGPAALNFSFFMGIVVILFGAALAVVGFRPTGTS
jgi:uncharacterized membrane protein